MKLVKFLYIIHFWIELIDEPPTRDEPECSVHCEHENINSQNIYINLHCGISLLHPGTTICNTLHKEMGLLEYFKVSFKVPVFKKHNQVPDSLGPELGFVKKRTRTKG